MYNYVFDTEFVCGSPASSIHVTAIRNAEDKFNHVKRKKQKKLAVSLNSMGGLRFILDSDIPIDNENWLKSCQYFSKELAKERIMSRFVRPKRMLKR